MSINLEILRGVVIEYDTMKKCMEGISSGLKKIADHAAEELDRNPDNKFALDVKKNMLGASQRIDLTLKNI